MITTIVICVLIVSNLLSWWYIANIKRTMFDNIDETIDLRAHINMLREVLERTGKLPPIHEWDSWSRMEEGLPVSKTAPKSSTEATAPATTKQAK